MGLLRKTFGALFSSAIPDKPAHGMRWGIDKQYCKEIKRYYYKIGGTA